MGIFSQAGNAISSTLAKVLKNPMWRPPKPGELPKDSPTPPGQPTGSEQTSPNVQIINDWIVPSTLGWTLDALQSAILQLENGNLYSAHSLMLAMTRDATVGHGLRTYNLSLSALPWEIQFPRSIPEVARQALLKRWDRAVTPQDLATASAYQVMLGLAPGVQVWRQEYEETGEKFWHFEHEVLESGHLQFRPDTRRYYFVSRDGYREVVDDGNAWTLYKSLGDRRHHLDSAVRTLAVLWFIVQEAIRYHRAYNAEYGRPIKALMVPDQQRVTEDVAGLVQQAAGLYGGSVIVLPQFDDSQGQANFDLKLVEAKSRGYGTFLELADVARKLITLYLVGVLDTTQSGAGSHGKASAQERVAERYLMAGARIREDALNRVLARWAEFNGFDEAPKYVVTTQPPEDVEKAAEIASKRAAALKATYEALSKMSEWVTVTEAKAEHYARVVVGVDLAQRPSGSPLAPSVQPGGGSALEHDPAAVLVCWVPPPGVAQALAVPGGEPWEELHLTLALVPDGSLPDVVAALVAFAGTVEPVEGFVRGAAAWEAMGPGERSDMGDSVELPVSEPRGVPGSDEQEQAAAARAEADAGDEARGQGADLMGVREPGPQVGHVAGKGPVAQDHDGAKPSPTLKAGDRQLASVDSGGADDAKRFAVARGRAGRQLAYSALVDAPGLQELRAKLVAALTVSGVEVRQDHGFIPHVTRAYLPAGSKVAPPAEVPVTVDTLSVWALGGRVRVPVRIGSIITS